MIRERINAGIKRAKAQGVVFGPKSTRVPESTLALIRADIAAGHTIRTIAETYGVGVGTVARLKAGQYGESTPTHPHQASEAQCAAA
jgi:DNA invertase Pin-like site-specific DNA recombinase